MQPLHLIYYERHDRLQKNSSTCMFMFLFIYVDVQYQSTADVVMKDKFM